MMRFLIDMNLSRGWVGTLAAAGHEAAHWIDVGAPDALDHAIMAFARANAFTVITRDLDFGEMLALTGASGPSVVQLRGGDAMPDVAGPDVLAVLARFEEQIERRALVTISLSASKVRILPIGDRRP